MTQIHRIFYHRPRLASSIVFGLIVGMLVPSHWDLITRTLLGWNVAVWTYLLLMGWLMSRANHARVCKIAQQEDRSGVAVLFFMSLGAIASVAAIVWELASIKELSSGLRLTHYALTGATIIGSWCLVAVLYTFHYARLFYTAPKEQLPLEFPDAELSPDYWDFLYFSFTIAVAAQTSDVVIKSRAMRKTVLAQSILSFLFNVAILGFSINIAASVVNPS